MFSVKVRRKIKQYLERKGITDDKVDASVFTMVNGWTALHEAVKRRHCASLEVIAE